MKKRREFFFLLPLFFFHQKKKKKDRSSKRPKGKNMSFCGKNIIPSETWRKESVCIHILVREYLKELTPSLGCTFQKKNPFSSLRTFFFFRIFPLLSLHSRGSPRCNATPRENKSLSPKFPFLFRYLPLSCLLSILFLKRGKEKNTKTYVYVLYVFSRKTIKVIWKETEK